LVAKQRTAIALGFNINDYIVGSTYVYTNPQGQKQSPVTNEPQGNYWGAGPTLFADVSLSEKLVLHVFSAYSISLLRTTSVEYAIEDNSYPKPHFLHFNAELQTRGHLYAGVDFTALLNQGNNPNATQRIDLLVGYRF
jgi:hypothetical protein